MRAFEQTTIAQVLYPDVTGVDFARIVAELEAVLLRLPGGAVEMTWDCDDLVTFEVPQTRILLAWSGLEAGAGGCLTVSVGPDLSGLAGAEAARHEVLCNLLVERIERRYQPAGVIWRQVEGPVGADLIDALSESLPQMQGPSLPLIHMILEALSRADLKMAGDSVPVLRMVGRGKQEAEVVEDVVPALPAVEMPEAEPVAAVAVDPFPEVANDRPDLPRERCEELVRVREALYAPVEGEVPAYSTQMRLATHCLNATLICVWAPLGAAVMTYSLLKGEDMRLSGRLMAVTGTLLALADTPMGQTMAAMAKGLV